MYKKELYCVFPYSDIRCYPFLSKTNPITYMSPWSWGHFAAPLNHSSPPFTFNAIDTASAVLKKSASGYTYQPCVSYIRSVIISPSFTPCNEIRSTHHLNLHLPYFSLGV